MAEEEQLELASKLLGIKKDEVKNNSSSIPELSALYVSIAIKGGDSLIIGKDGQVLYANSSVGFDNHLKAYKEGKRTPLESFENYNK